MEGSVASRFGPRDVATARTTCVGTTLVTVSTETALVAVVDMAEVSVGTVALVTAGAQEEITIATAKLIVEKTKRSFIFFILLMLSIMK